MSTDLRALLSLDLSLKQSSLFNLPFSPSSITASSISTHGSWLALCGQSPRETCELHVLDLRRPFKPQIHLHNLDTRHISSPIGQMTSSKGTLQVAFHPDEELFFVLFSHPAFASFSWGWRASVACFETHTGRPVWHAEIDAEITSDARSIADLDKDPHFIPAITCHKNHLYINTMDGGIATLDARDGALIHTHHHASIHGIVEMHYLEDTQQLIMLNEAGMLSVKALHLDAKS